MKKSIIKITGIILLFIFSNTLTKAESTIYLYYNLPFLASMTIQVTFNNVKAFTMTKNTKIKCNLLSKGEINISFFQLMGRDNEIVVDYKRSMDLNVQENQSYYVKIFLLSGNNVILKLMSEEVGKQEYESSRYELLPDYNENPANPIVKPLIVENNAINYQEQRISQAPGQNADANKPNVTEAVLNSDVDKDIPVVENKNENRFALIIGNEDYSSYQNGLESEANVIYAANDAKAFKSYCFKTLGVPEENIVMLINARTVEFNREISKLNLYAKNSKGNAEIIFYYAGHGLPDEVTKAPYLIPVDVSGSDLKFAIKLTDLYTKLTEFPSKKITVFLDACFSGGARSQGLIAARSVKIKPENEQLNGNLVVFSASTGDQSSLPFKEKGHGMFTYYLLKKLQETKGGLTYKELSDYISEKVSINSLRVNNREQNPQTNVSPNLENTWGQWSFSK